MSRFILIFLAIVLVFSAPANAENTGFGLAMHGAPKYGPGAKYLDYANPAAPKGGSIKIAGTGSFDTVNPFTLKGKAAEGLNLAYDRLMTRVWDEPFTMYPLIAQSYEMPDDRSWIAFNINPKARFGDGSSITADDVLFSFETLKKSGRPNMRRVYKIVTKAEKTGPSSVKFAFGAGRDRETPLILAMMPVLSKKWWAGRNFDATLLTPPVSSGPYKIAAIEPGRKIVYERDAAYWAKDMFPNAGQFNFDKVIYDYYRDDTVAFEAFKAGALDFRKELNAGQWAGAYDFPAVKEGRVTLDPIKHGRPERTLGFIFNARREPFNDIRVRRALDLLFDFEWVNKTLFQDQYKRIDSVYPNSELASHSWNPSGNASPAQKRANMREADRLLTGAGWVIKDGARLKKGKPFAFEILVSAPEDQKIALNFRESLKKMGIEANIRMLDAANYLSRLNEYDFDMTLYYWLSTLSPGGEQALYWGCAAASEKGRFNYAGICDPEIDALAKKIAEAKDRAELVASARALDKKIMEGYYFIPLYYAGADFAAYYKPIKRPAVTPLYGMALETWWRDRAAVESE